MKRHIWLMAVMLFILAGCSMPGSGKADKPYKIAKGASVLSYYDTKDEIDIDGFNILENTPENTVDYMWHRDNNILVNEDGEIRSITVTDKEVKTFRSISVGDSVDKIERAFEQLSEFNGVYSVTFNGDTEVAIGDPVEDTFIRIRYFTDEDKITAIQIHDLWFGERTK